MTRVIEVVRRGRQGPAGPQGPAGADGATGATGPEGPAGTGSPAFGAVHDHAFLRRSALDLGISKNVTYSGSNLRFAGISDGTQSSTSQADNTSPAGTWLSLGSVRASATDFAMTLFRRIA